MAGQPENVYSVATPYKAYYALGSVVTILPTKSVITLKTNGTGGITFQFEKSELILPDGRLISLNDIDPENYTLNLIGTYTVKYTGQVWERDLNGFPIKTENYNLNYYFAAIENHLPLKRKTVTDVIKRLFDVAEPIRKGQKPRFRLRGINEDGSITEGSQAALLDKIYSPEFTFTKETLRECLQEIGKFIHGEPRADIAQNSDGSYYFEVSFDMYAQQEETGIWHLPYISRGVQHNVETFTSSLDSSAENLVNQLDKLGGVIVEPYSGGAKSVRTETPYTRIEDSNFIIVTQERIQTIDKLECVYSENGALKSVDITKYVFESSVYNSQLSSYSGEYPYSKAYGLYFKQGEKNIYGLNFKEPSAAFAPFNNYAIINILRQATGNSQFGGSDLSNFNYASLAFRVTYTPFYNVRVAQTKAYQDGTSKPTALIYNQQANVIESRAFGENLKGAVARLGNVDRTVTFLAKWMSDVPRAGLIFKKDYYISAVATEILPNIIRCTLGLSKDFNRLSAYIGISSNKRYYQVSEKQAVERNVLYRNYISIGYSPDADNDSIIRNPMLQAIAATFTQTGDYRALTAVKARGTTYKGNPAGANVILPVISSAFGNSISFSWKYADNFSAGAASVPQQNSEVSGYFQQDVPYTDFYGGIYYYDFDILPTGTALTSGNIGSLPYELPKDSQGESTYNNSYISTSRGNAPFILRKDNREVLQINVQIDFVTQIKDFIIGSALSAYCPAVRGIEEGAQPARLYVFPTTLNKFTDRVEAYENVKLSELPYSEVEITPPTSENGYFVLNAGLFPASGKAWAIVTQQSVMLDTVEDEEGNTVTQSVITGGDLLIGQNIDVTQGQAFKTLYFNAKSNVYDMAVWKNKI